MFKSATTRGVVGMRMTLEGLLYSIHRAGKIVAEMTDYDIQDLLATRFSGFRFQRRRLYETSFEITILPPRHKDTKR